MIMEKLPIEFKEKWVAALRSGEYKRGYGMLYNPAYNCFCVWGVAEMACGNEVKNIQGYHTPGSGFYKSNLPELRPEIIRNLMTLNDTTQLSFSKIADYIEANL